MRPRTRCEACATKHIECDGLRPTCGQCQTRGSACVWWVPDAKTLVFHSENQYAPGTQRRPRGRRAPRYTVRTAEESSSAAILPAAPTSMPLEYLAETACALSICQPSLIPPITQFALQKYRVYCSRNPPWLASDYCLGFQGFLSFYDGKSVDQQPRLLLEAAWTSMALVYFGRSAKSRTAITLSSDSYRRALALTRTAIQNADRSDIPDELVLTVMLLANYEDKMGAMDRLTFVPASFKHDDGAVALICQRVNGTNRTPTSMVLDTLVRWHYIRNCILQCMRVPELLCESDKFLESSRSRLLTICMIHLAELQARKREAFLSPSFEELRCILRVAQQINRKVCDLQQPLSPFPVQARSAWHAHVKHVPSLADGAALRKTPNMADVQLWIDSHATRLRVDTVVVQAARMLESLPARQMDTGLADIVIRAQQNIRSSAECILAAIPYYFPHDIGLRAPRPTGAANAVSRGFDSCSLFFALHSIVTSSQAPALHKQAAAHAQLHVASLNGTTLLERLYTPGGPFAVNVVQKGE
ncbi:hypothetical protein BDY17DRAFT_167194 [Neohortaea acidophila]|uniref:Zn(2)-C6 fungal-type domain-containing protein n=1 Tax=Neohortaea acidophila TaxID=245834 RepID=A0A6A6PRU7_9PEZI|nr:uncharacterized protein BDY17DRAFT_167194 [Neohortaea acidophila]KAF2482830.1 hypothetical protein BDY17DRAFT_167194 [Neohortaea acidophila]